MWLGLCVITQSSQTPCTCLGLAFRLLRSCFQIFTDLFSHPKGVYTPLWNSFHKWTDLHTYGAVFIPLWISFNAHGADYTLSWSHFYILWSSFHTLMEQFSHIYKYYSSCASGRFHVYETD